MDFNQLALVSFLVESIIQTIKPVYSKDKGFNRDAVFALVVSIFVCALASVDLFQKAGLPLSLPYAGSVLTGIIASRGSSLVHDVMKFVQNAAHPNEPVGGVG